MLEMAGPPDMQHDFGCRVFWDAAGAAASGDAGRSPIDRVALGKVVGDVGRIGAIAMLVCAFNPYRAVKVPWAGALPPDAGRDVPLAIAAPERLREHACMAAERARS